MSIYYLSLRHPSGRRTIKKYRSKKKSPRAVKLRYYGTQHHFSTEASVTRVSRKRPKRR